MRDIEEIVEILYIPGQVDRNGNRFIRSIKCRKCGEFLFKDGGKEMSRGDFSGLIKAIALHFQLNHDIDVVFHECSDPRCLKKR